MNIREPHILIRLAWLFAVFGFVCPLFGALDIDSLKPEGYLSDYAHVVNPQDKQQIEQYCYQIEQSLGVQIGLVTIPSLENRDIETVANQLFRHFGVGSKQGNKGVLLLLAVQDRKSRIEVGYGIEPYLTDGFSGSILRSMRPQLQSSNYGAALLEGAHEIGTQVSQGLGQQITPDNKQPPRIRRVEPRSGIPFPLIIFGLFFLFWLLGRGGRGRGGRGGGGGGFLPGLLIGNMLGGRRSGDWGGGGFGGWDSGGGGGGGGFGGFGGGSSGGGGASSDW